MANTVSSTIDDEAITGAFALAVDVLFSDLSAGPSQDVFEFSDASGGSRIWFGQVGGTRSVEFGIARDGVVHRVVADDAIVEGEWATWRVGVDPDGTMRIAKDYDLLAEGPGAVPDAALRDSRLIGASADPDDADLSGTVLNLRIANYGDLAELDPAFQASPCATTGEVRCLCDKLRPDGAVVPGADGGTEIPATDPEGDGEWSGVQSLGIIPIHAIVLPDGKIFSFGTDETGTQGGQFVYSLYDPETGIDVVLPNATGTDVFCSSMALDPVTGNVLITGGDARGEGGAVNDPINDVVVFDYATRTMRTATQGEMAYDRWYNTTVTLSNGEILTLGGTGGGKDVPEVFNAVTGWRTLTGVEMTIPYYYPKVWVTSDDMVVVVSGKGQMYRIDPEGVGSAEAIGRVGFAHANNRPGIMYDVDKVAIVGNDQKIWVADLSEARPVFTEAADLGTSRQDAGMSLLPDGRVIITGGSEGRNDLDSASYAPQIWDPRTGTVETVADAALPRLYHSSHLLMPDGTIWTGGGGAPGPLVNTNFEVYAPDYLYDAAGGPADRPEITAAPANVGNGETFRVSVGDAAGIARVTAVRAGGSTHAVNTDARFVDLDFTVVDGTTLELATLPPGAMVPGAWMLFVLDADGVPSEASMLGVAMADLVDTPNLLPVDAGLDVYGIDDDEIAGAFEITLEARFDDVEGGSFQRLFDFGNGAGADNVLLGQVGSSDDIYFAVWADGRQHSIVAPGAIVEGEVAKWTANVDAAGHMRLWKDDVLVAEGRGAVPADVAREGKLVGRSHWPGDDRLDGMVRYLETVNAGDAPEYVHIGAPRISLRAPEDVVEGDAGDAGTLRFEVVLDQPAPAIVSAAVAVAGGTGPAEIVVPAGRSSAFIDVTFQGDDVLDAARRVTVTLTDVRQARVVEPLEASARVLDDDGAGTWLRARYFAVDPEASLAAVDFGATPLLEEIVFDVSEFAEDGGAYPGGADGACAAQFEGGFWVAAAGAYTFHLGTDDSAALFVDGAAVLGVPGGGGPVTRSVTVDLKPGQHAIELRCLDREGGASLDLAWEGPGIARARMDFTPAPPPGPSVSGRYFVDADATGTATEGDGAVAGALVRLLRDGVEVAQTTTDGAGRYAFEAVAPGDGYRVAFENPATSVGQALDFVTTRLGGDPGLDSDVIWTDGRGDGTTYRFAVPAQGGVDGIDAGLVAADAPPPEPAPEPRPGATGVTGRYFVDQDGDGSRGAGDPAVAGARVTLLRDGAAIAETVTRADGSYAFAGIAAGEGYRVAFQRPADALGRDLPFITERHGGDASADSDVIWTDGRGDGTTHRFAVPEGAVLEGIDGGLDGRGSEAPTGPASVSGLYFVDRDGSRTVTAGDDAVGDAAVQLIRAGEVVARTRTDADGRYAFDGVEPGDGYRVRFQDALRALDAALPFVESRAGGDPEADSDVVRVNGGGKGISAPFGLAPGSHASGVNAGLDGDGPTTLAAEAQDAQAPDRKPVHGTAGPGPVVIQGGSGDDRLMGSAADEALHGHGGRDLLVGGGGADSLSGGEDGDIFVLRPGAADAAVTIEDWGRGGRDLLVIDDRLLGIGDGGRDIRLVTRAEAEAALGTGLVAFDGRTGSATVDADGRGGPDDPVVVAQFEDGALVEWRDVFLF